MHGWIVGNLQAFSFPCGFDATPSQPVLAIERSRQNLNHWLSGMQMETLNRIREWCRVLTAQKSQMEFVPHSLNNNRE